MHTGELTAKPLDREMQSRYHLQITAQDRGSPITYQSTCNISIAVEDQNDSNPRFDWIVKNGLCSTHFKTFLKFIEDDLFDLCKFFLFSIGLARYTVTVAEDVAIGTPILTVKATDADIGTNSQIVYSLANETDWLFSVDNRSGVITTTG